MKRSARSGFTLLEVLAASGLSVVLMLGVYRAMDLSSHYRRVANGRSNSDQVATTLLRLLESELAAVDSNDPIVSPPVTDPTWIQLDSAWSPFDAVEANTPSLATDTTKAARPLAPRRRTPAIVGNARTLVITGGETKRGSDGRPSSDQARVFGGTDRGELRMPEPWPALLAGENPRLDQASLREQRDTIVCLVATLERTHRDDLSNGPSWRTATTRPLANDLTEVRFRYHDGIQWHLVWTGAERFPLRAVEVTVIAGIAAAERKHQLVIPVGIRSEMP